MNVPQLNHRKEAGTSSVGSTRLKLFHLLSELDVNIHAVSRIRSRIDFVSRVSKLSMKPSPHDSGQILRSADRMRNLHSRGVVSRSGVIAQKR
ncbi:Uncharacterized protein HZ326_5375 [Fusarium oxysporum f. sp. albedinis]|nr:Uncharacterized protein HZ326_5375 [Fusarium oxysporum f. sp. albedinis]